MSPRMSLWPLGMFCSYPSTLTFLPIKLSTMRLLQSMWAPSMMMLFSTSVLVMVELSPMLV